MKSERRCSCACCRAVAERRATTKAKHDAAKASLYAAGVALDTAQIAMDDLWSALDALEETTHEGDDWQGNGNDFLLAFVTRQTPPDWN